METVEFEYSCPAITCREFNKSFAIECDPRPTGFPPTPNEPICDDDLECGGCGTRCDLADQVEATLKELVRDREHARYDGPDLNG